MIGGQKSFGIFKTPFDNHSEVPTMRDSNPVARVSWLQLIFSAGFSRLLVSRADLWSDSIFDNLACNRARVASETHCEPRGLSPRFLHLGLLCLRQRRSSVTRSGLL